jgi:molybdenum cofactor synthesis domain-containing protein
MYTVGIITISDKGYNGKREDITGCRLSEFLKDNNFEIIYKNILPDEQNMISSELIHICDNLKPNLLITNGGTGFSPRDVTPEATLSVIEKQIPGFGELMRANSLKTTPKAILSRAVSGIRSKTIIINLPGSPKAAIENLQYLLPALPHGIDILCENASECATT